MFYLFYSLSFEFTVNFEGLTDPKTDHTDKEVQYFENFDLELVITPVNWKRLKYLLDEAGYDKKKTEFLVRGFRDGFRLEYEGDPFVMVNSPNLKLTVGDETDLWNKVMKEIRLKRYAGPYKKIPFKHYIQSPIGLVPKDGGKDTRLIFHLSYPRNVKDGQKSLSVNANTPSEKCKVKYPDFSEAIRRCMEEGKNCYTAKSDMKMAFRNLGLFPGDFKYLVMKAKNPKDGKWYYMVDKCLPFGASISCFLFQSFSNCVAFLVAYRSHRDPVNYLDDFLFAALLKYYCNQQVEIFLTICAEINFPVNLERHCGRTPS